jgi:hypothetical protein
MSRHFQSRRGKKQNGYAFLLVVFLTTLMLISVLAVAPSIKTERQREKEEEMIWRGNQYVGAIKRFYRKNGRFPTSLDDLTKPKQGSLRYLRQAYKDPMNKEDGTWRLIYVGPAGQLIGSLKPPQTFQMPTANQTGTPVATPPGANPTAPATGTPGSAPQNGTPQGTDQSGLTPAGSTPTDTPTIIGGNIIGVGSKVNKKSVIVYEKATNYHLFEFVWDPSKDNGGVGGPTGVQIGTPAGPGQAPGSGTGMPPMGNPNPQPAPQQPPTSNPPQ